MRVPARASVSSEGALRINDFMDIRDFDMIKLNRLAHVLIACRDLQASKNFYVGVLGLGLLEEDPEHGGAFLSVGSRGNAVDLFQSDDPEATPPSTGGGGDPFLGIGVKHVAFGVTSEDELKEAYFALQDAGIKILRTLEHESQRSIYFNDPDGNLLEICWERPNALEIFAQGRGDNNDQFSYLR